MTDRLQRTHGDGNCCFPTQLLERIRELDPMFKITFLLYDEISFECKEGNHEAIMQLMQDHMLAVLESGHVVMTVDTKVEF